MSVYSGLFSCDNTISQLILKGNRQLFPGLVLCQLAGAYQDLIISLEGLQFSFRQSQARLG